MRNGTFKRDSHMDLGESTVLPRNNELHRALLQKSLADLCRAPNQECWSLRAVLWLWQSYFASVSQHKEDSMSSPRSSCTEIQKPKFGTAGFTQQQFSLFSEDLDAPKSISVFYKCSTATADKPPFDVNPRGSYLKKAWPNFISCNPHTALLNSLLRH